MSKLLFEQSAAARLKRLTDEEAGRGERSLEHSREHAGGNTVMLRARPVEDEESSGCATPTADLGRNTPPPFAFQDPSAMSAIPLLRRNPLHWDVKLGIIQSSCPTYDARPETPRLRRPRQ